jgi:hypothetical protein
MNKRDALAALSELSASPSAEWIGNRASEGRWMKKCMRCGVEETMIIPSAFYRDGGIVWPRPEDIPAGFDEKLLIWMRAFQRAHEGCREVALGPGPGPGPGAGAGVGRSEAARADARLTFCKMHGVRRWQGHVICDACSQTYQAPHGDRTGNAPDVCRCGQPLLPPVEDRVGDVMGLQVEGLAIDQERLEGRDWTARPICYLCFRKIYGGMAPVDRGGN